MKKNRRVTQIIEQSKFQQETYTPTFKVKENAKRHAIRHDNKITESDDRSTDSVRVQLRP